MQMRSSINAMLTLKYMQEEHENKYFDRKSAKVKPSDLAPLISAFANADGGTIVIGISDKTRIMEGVAKNIVQFYPNCRIRFLRYEGTTAMSGTKINISRDKNIELSAPAHCSSLSCFRRAKR